MALTLGAHEQLQEGMWRSLAPSTRVSVSVRCARNPVRNLLASSTSCHRYPGPWQHFLANPTPP
jgi:hypothetical protein